MKCLKTLLAAIGDNGANLKVLKEAMQRKDRKGFVSMYITPNIEFGYIAMLTPETPNHPMQSYYLTNKGRDFEQSIVTVHALEMLKMKPNRQVILQ